MELANKTFDQEQDDKILEIQEYHSKSLTELVILLTKEPIVRHFKGGYYRVVGIGRDCEDASKLVVIYKSLDYTQDTFMWSRELLEFLSPVPESSQEFNVTGQKRRFELINNFSVQLDLVPTKDLLDELSERDNDHVTLDKELILSDDYIIGRVLPDMAGNPYVQMVYNSYDTHEAAEDGLKRAIRNKKLKGNSFYVLRRMISSGGKIEYEKE